MVFDLLPASDANTASSRLRVHALAKGLQSIGEEVSFTAGAGDVLMVQKRLDRRILRDVARAHRRGAAIIYDLDDTGDALDFWASPGHRRRMLELTHLVTTDTEGHAAILRQRHPEVEVRVVPDGIDYDPPSPVRNHLPADGRLRVLWFGSYSNIGLFEPYVQPLLALPDLEVVVATSAEQLPELQRRHPRISPAVWRLDTFVELMRSCHLSCLMHDGGRDQLAKSNNRMLASITWGVPAMVSATPEYTRTAAAAGVPWTVFSDGAGLADLVTRLRAPAERERYLDSAQPAIWDSYHPAAIARTFLAAAATARERVGTPLPERGWWSALVAKMQGSP